MKIFNTINELWNYCDFCPLCQQKSCDMQLTIGPDFEYLKLHKLKKSDEIFTLNCSYYSPFTNVEYINFDINCNNNTFICDSEELSKNQPEELFYFFIEGVCNNCAFIATTVDLTFDFNDFKIKNIGLERETLSIFDEDIEYRVIKDFLNNKLIITVPKKNKVTLPLLDFDIQNKEQTIKKIKTILLFS